jgi:Ni/Co efflux regulator RcnB
MKNFRSVGITLLALSMGMGSVASAQDRGPHDSNDRHSERHGPAAGYDHTAVAGDIRNHRDNRDNRADHDSARSNPYHGVRGEARDQQGDWRGAGPRVDLRPGAHLSPEYRGRQYVVDDWRGRHLSAPPRGYQWVQAGGDYVLAAIATGVILQILLNN